MDCRHAEKLVTKGLSLQEALTSEAQHESTLRLLPDGVYSIPAGQPVTIPEHNQAIPFLGTTIEVRDTLTINGPFLCGPKPVFNCLGAGKVVFGPDALVVGARPEWWAGLDYGAAINAAMASLPDEGGAVILSRDRSFEVPVRYPKNKVRIVSIGRRVKLTYTGIEAGIGALDKEGVYTDECGFERVSLYAPNAVAGFDFTGFRYGQFRDFKIDVRAANSSAIYGKKMAGVESNPSYNNFDTFWLSGNAPAVAGQTGIKFEFDPAVSLGSPYAGPSGNNFSNIQRITSFDIDIDLIAGTGNNFHSIQMEGTIINCIRLGYIAVPDDTGTFTSGGDSQFTDASKHWPEKLFTSGSIKVVGGTGVGQSGRILSHTANTVKLDGTFAVPLDETSEYELYVCRAKGNNLWGMRIEDSLTCNPVRFGAGASLNKVRDGYLSGVSAPFIVRDIDDLTNIAVF